ncbi:MAG: ABC transporter substrate-binding protein [Verrucomicrobiota bacterium]
MIKKSLATVSLFLCTIAHTHGENAQRIISLGGSITEIAWALGAEDRIIACDSSSQFPAEVRDLTQVGYVAAVSAEGLIAEKPDMIIASSRLGPPAAVEILKNTGIPLKIFPNPNDAASLESVVMGIGEALGLEESAKQLWSNIKADLAMVNELTAAKPETRVVFLLGRGGAPLAAGTGTQAAGIISLAGGTNIFSDYSGYKSVTTESLISEAPDFILIGASFRNPGSDPKSMLENMGLAQVGEVTQAKVKILDMGKFLTFGPRTGDAAKELAEIFTD